MTEEPVTYLSIDRRSMSHTIRREVMLKTVPAMLQNTLSNELITLKEDSCYGLEFGSNALLFTPPHFMKYYQNQHCWV